MAEQATTSPKDLQPFHNLVLRLYRQLLQSATSNSPHHGNLIISPTILLISLQQLYLASHGKSREQFQKLLKIPDTSLHAIFHDLGNHIQAASVGKTDRHHDFFAGTKILLNQGVQVQPALTEELEKLPHNKEEAAVVQHVQADLKAIESLINQLAKEITGQRIENITTEQKLLMDKDSLLFLSFATFFSDWENKFVQRSSVNYEGRQRQAVQALPATLEDFHNADGTTAKVLMVHLQGKIFLTRDEKLKVTIAEIPMNQYDNNLVIVLPDETGKNSLKHFEGNFKEDTFDILRQNWQMPLTHVYLPKFSLENHFSLSKDLQDLGVKDIFTAAKADLAGISTTAGLHVADVVHAASIDISCETGKVIPKPETSAPAGQCSGALMPDTFATGFHVNRPFFFLVRPRTPEMWSVMGRVVHLETEPDVTVWNHHKQQKAE